MVATTHYCRPEVEKLDYSRNNPTCKKRNKGYVHQANSNYNNCRFDQVWLER
jgi:hypothetical protein